MPIRSGQLVDRGQVEDEAIVVPQREVDRGAGQGDPREGLAEVAQFGLGRPEKLAADGRVVEQVADLDGRAERAAAGRDFRNGTPDDFDLRSAGSVAAVRLRIASRLISAIEAIASPRNPRVPTQNRSSAVLSLLVA